MSRTFSSGRSLVAVGATLLLATSASAQVDDDTPPFTPFRVNVVDGGILNASMPFDAKFIIWGDVPAERTEVTLELRTLTSDDLTCDGSGVAGASQPPLKQRVTVKTRKWTARDYDTHGVKDSTTEVAGKDVQFEMLVNELAPNAFYCLTLDAGRPLTSTEGDRLLNALRPAFQAFLGSLSAVQLNGPAQAQLEPLRQAFIAAIMAAAPFRIAPRAGTMFDKDIKTAKVAAEFNNSTLAVFEEHARVRDRLDNFNNGAAAGAKVLTNLAQQAATALKTPGLDQAFQDRFRPMAELPPELISRRLNGLPPPPVAFAPLGDSWESDLALPAPAAGTAFFPINAPCPTRGAFVDRCKLITDTGNQLQALVGPFPAAVPNASELTAALNAALIAVQNQKTQLLFAQLAINNRFAAMNTVLQMLDAQIIAESFSQLMTTAGSAATRRTWYLAMDTGIAVAPAISEVFPYMGTAMFFRPVNKKVPPSSIGTRFSLLFGFTWTANLQKTGERKALFGDNATVLFGAGFRLTEWLRLTAGGVLFKAVNPNPLLNEDQLKITPFISMSADIDAADLLKSVFGANAKPPDSGRVLSETVK